ncbi:relaxase/mobilization nuclease domain-containing protein [Ruminococcaceae bacterium OttesenSCG-928-L11]|nr:relaxase/mobilization nuclease domain-containing protein [Ruminococcaceae bacterium OttesenSCG-928-L11]
MAATWMRTLHVNKGKTIAQTITDRTDYAENPEKTSKGELIIGYQCDPLTVDAEFLLSKRQYKHITGRDQGRRDVLAYHIRQSFKPGEIDPEHAGRVGQELAMRFTKGRHAFIVATHIDRAHIHNHIVFNSTSLDCTRKFEDFKGSAWAVRRLSDQICLEHGLSVIENPQPRRGRHYGTWLGDDRKPSYRELLRQAIDSALEQKPADLDAFLAAMKAAGYKIKHGKHLAFKAADQKNFTRLRSLGDGYSEQDIWDCISGKRPRTTSSPQVDSSIRPNLLIDIQARIQAGKGPGYERWGKLHNLKEMARTLIFLEENHLTDYAALEHEAVAAAASFRDLSAQIKAAEARMTEVNDLQKHIGNYNRTRDIYRQYKAAKFSRAFRSEHEGAILLHLTAKKAFDALGVEKLPTIKSLQTEYGKLMAEKKRLYRDYRQARDRMRSLQTAKANTDSILRAIPASELEQQR